MLKSLELLSQYLGNHKYFRLKMHITVLRIARSYDWNRFRSKKSVWEFLGHCLWASGISLYWVKREGHSTWQPLILVWIDKHAFNMHNVLFATISVQHKNGNTHRQKMWRWRLENKAFHYKLLGLFICFKIIFMIIHCFMQHIVFVL